MEQENWRFTLSPDKYLEKTHVMIYLEDALAQLLEYKEENPKVNPSTFFSNYFISVKAGHHVLLREYSFIKATAHNRASFVQAFWRCFSNIGRKGDMLSISEYHSLACLLCPDFPIVLFQKTAKIILQNEATENSLVSFTDFIYAFQLQFCFDEFLAKSSEIYRSMIQNPTANHLDAVIVPTTEERPVQPSVEASKPIRDSFDVDSKLFLHALTVASGRLESNCPPTDILREVLSEKDRTTFFEFLTNMFKCAKLNHHIGKLPPKSEILTMTAQELNLLKTTALEKLLVDNLSSTSPHMMTELTRHLTSPPLDVPVQFPGSSSQQVLGLTGADLAGGHCVWATSVEPKFPPSNSSNPTTTLTKSKSTVVRKTVARRRKVKSKQFAASSSGSDNDYIDDDSNSDSNIFP